MTTALRLRRLVGLAAWLAALGVTIAVLSALRRSALAPPPITHGVAALRAWARGRDAPTVLMAALRLVALAMAWYLAATTVAGVLARLSGAAAAVRATDALTLPAVRSLLSSSVGLLLLSAPLAGATSVWTGTAASAAAPVPAVAGGGAPWPGGEGPPGAAAGRTHSLSIRRLPDVPRPSSGDGGGGVDVPPVMTLSPPVPGAPNGARTVALPTTWTVEPGDSLWHIADAVMAQAKGRPPQISELGPYWEAVVDANRGRLADPDNPDLLFPGQVMTVPPPPT